jgi:hypothetical protein
MLCCNPYHIQGDAQWQIIDGESEWAFPTAYTAAPKYLSILDGRQKARHKDIRRDDFASGQMVYIDQRSLDQLKKMWTSCLMRLRRNRGRVF